MLILFLIFGIRGLNPESNKIVSSLREITEIFLPKKIANFIQSFVKLIAPAVSILVIIFTIIFIVYMVYLLFLLFENDDKQVATNLTGIVVTASSLIITILGYINNNKE